MLKESVKRVWIAHGNTRRALVMHLANMTEAEVEDFEVPTGRPLILKLADDQSICDQYYLETKLELPN